MRVLIDIGHPAHVHLFGPFGQQMIERGHEVLYTCREKEFEIELLKGYDLPYISFGKKFHSLVGKLFGLVKFDILEFFHGIKFKPDIMMSHGSPYAAHAAFLLNKPHISLEDTGNMEQVRLYLPFTRHVLTATSFKTNLGKKQLRYRGYHELAYLHPELFTPDENIYDRLGLDKGQAYCLVRFVAWKASHDRGHSGLSLALKRRVIEKLSSNMTVLISSEEELPKEFEKYRIKILPKEIHSAIAFAQLVVGESCTMASEAAMLGTPAILISGFDKNRFGTLIEQEKYGLLNQFEHFEESVMTSIDQVIDAGKNVFLNRRNAMLKEKINLAKFMIWFIENYPESVEVLQKEGPGFRPPQ